MDIDVEYLASENWDEREMHARFAWLRENDPVRWSEKDGLWLVTRFRDVAYCSKHQELFTSAQGVRPGNPAKLGLIDEDEPRHGQLRGLINKGFTPRMVKKLETVFRKITTDAIDEVAGRGECDFVDDIAVPLPLRLIAAMMGIRDEDYDRFHRWSDAMIAADGNMDDPEVVVNASTAYMEYGAYVSEIIEDRRRNPQDDLISILTGAKDQGLLREYNEDHAFRHLEDRDPSLEKDELIKLLVILMVAGNETTRNGISGGMQLLIENPAERQKLIDDPSLIRGAVEEMVRVVSPVHSFGRTVTQDTELRDRELTAGQTVLLLYPAANLQGGAQPPPPGLRPGEPLLHGRQPGPHGDARGLRGAAEADPRHGVHGRRPGDQAVGAGAHLCAHARALHPGELSRPPGRARSAALVAPAVGKRPEPVARPRAIHGAVLVAGVAGVEHARPIRHRADAGPEGEDGAGGQGPLRVLGQPVSGQPAHRDEGGRGQAHLTPMPRLHGGLRCEPAVVAHLGAVDLHLDVGRYPGQEEPGVEALRRDRGRDPAGDGQQLRLRQLEAGLLLRLANGRPASALLVPGRGALEVLLLHPSAGEHPGAGRTGALEQQHLEPFAPVADHHDGAGELRFRVHGISRRDTSRSSPGRQPPGIIAPCAASPSRGARPVWARR
jgi:cytochrome P450 family 142 subfamily A polypeptide 1